MPLLVAANRDEQLDRPAEPPQLRDGGVLAPRDLEAGGTWIGLNGRGLFAGITNRYGLPPNPALRWRGALVTRALEAATAVEAAERISALPAVDYNAFHLLVADRQGAHIIWSDGEALHVVDVPPGTAVLSERSFGAGESGREALLAERVPRLMEGDAPDDAALQALMATHDEPSFEGVCVHWSEAGYGTRHTTIVRLGSAQDQAQYSYCEGPPCETDMIGLPHLVGQLR